MPRPRSGRASLRGNVVGGISARLASRSPTLHRIVRRLWRMVARLLPEDTTYWDRRRHGQYYQEVIRLARVHVPAGGAVLDVGAATTEVILALDWFSRRVALDLNRVLRRPGIEAVVADFMDYDVPARFDLVICLQVLEHVDDPATFARKLLACGRTVIISVPYKWAPGHPGHVHDPIDEAKLDAWTAREPVTRLVVHERNNARLVAVYRTD